MRIALVTLASFGLVACNGLFGVDDLRYERSAAAGGASSSAASSSSGTGTVATGSGGSTTSTTATTTTTSGGAGGAGAGDSGGGGQGGAPPCTNRALQFDGVNDFVRVTDDNELDNFGDFTIELWFKDDTTSLGSGRFDLVSHSDINTGYVLYIDDGKIEAAGALPNPQAVGFLTLHPQNEWMHVAYGRDGSTMFVVTSEGKSDTFVGGSGSSEDFSGPLVIGARADMISRLFKGIIDEVRISSVARYTVGGYTPPTAPFVPDTDTVALWHFDEADGEQLAMDAATGHPGTLGLNTSTENSDPTRIDIPCIEVIAAGL
jgi:hypothetical protein